MLLVSEKVLAWQGLFSWNNLRCLKIHLKFEAALKVSNKLSMYFARILLSKERRETESENREKYI